MTRKYVSSGRYSSEGLSKSHPLYYRWYGMIGRCYSKEHGSYHRYGGRGITVCDRWKHFTKFVEDMFPTFQKELSLERVDNNKGYNPDNCKWATRKEQQNNMRSNRYITYQGQTLTITEWSTKTGVRLDTLFYRLKAKWPLAEALSSTKRPGGRR